MRAARPLVALLLLLLLLLASAGARAAPEEPAAVRVAPKAKQPALAIDAEGAVYVAFLEAGNVVVAVSADRARTFGPPRLAIDAKGRARAGRQRGPRIAARGKGLLALTAPLTFDDAETDKPYPTAELYLVTSKDGGATWTPPLRVNEVEKKAPEALHAMALAGDGTVHVAWLDLRERAGRGQDLWYARAADGKVGPNVRIAQTICECCAPAVVLDGKGNPVLAWREGGEDESREILAARSTDGGATFGKAARLNPENTKENG
jgi:hypothetical protein